MRAASLSIVLVLSYFAVAARGEEPPVPPAAARAGTAFACDLYAALRERPGNLFLSPYSVSNALAMTREGARGETARQMDAVLHLGDSRAEDHRALAKALRPGLVPDGYEDEPTVPAYELDIANALWGQEGLAFRPDFLARLRDVFGAPMEQIDFRKTEVARARINSWVSERTRERIRDIVPPGLPTPDTQLVLANAIYFKAAWHQPFEERWTKPGTFTTAAGAAVEVPFMHRVETYAYAETADGQVIELPYRGHHTSMVVVLPRRKDGLPDLERKLSPESLASWLGALKFADVSLDLPRFRVTCSLDLTETLPALGMRDAFDGAKANFSGMTEAERLFIGAVLHKAFIAVDEAGTEAAAATVVMMEKGGPPRNPPRFVADHPFLFLIRHRATGCVLFVGRVADPGA